MENKIKCPSCGIWYSEQQTATLQARVQELENKQSTHEHTVQRLIQQDIKLGEAKSRIAELESAVTEWRYATGAANERTWKVQKELADSQQHAEKLMVLLESMFHLAHDHETGQSDWQSYKQENGLQSPENPLP